MVSNRKNGKDWLIGARQVLSGYLSSFCARRTVDGGWWMLVICLLEIALSSAEDASRTNQFMACLAAWRMSGKLLFTIEKLVTSIAGK